MLSDMIPTGLHASKMAGVTFGDAVAVIGIGPVGLMALRGAVLHGAGRVFAVGSREKTAVVVIHDVGCPVLLGHFDRLFP